MKSTRCNEKYSSPAFGRRKHSLCHLPNGDSREYSSTHLLVRRAWNGSDLDLPASLEKGKQTEPEQRDMGYRPGGRSREPQERNLDLELNMMQFELFSLKQKMESSFAHLENEKKWLEKDRSEGSDQGEHREDNKWKPLSPAAALDSGQKGDLHGKKKVGRGQRALQESLSIHKKRIKALEAKQKEMVQHLKTAQEEKVELNQEVQHLTLELQCTQKKQDEIRDQVSVLHSELLSTRSQMACQETEKVLMKEELGSTKKAKEELSSEVAESYWGLEELQEKVHHLEAEKKKLDNHIQALEKELLQEKDKCPLQNQARDASLQESAEHLRESQALLEQEKIILQARCLKLEEALCNKQEEMDNQLAEQQKVSQSWRDRWEQVTADLKAKEEQLAETHRESQAFSTKVEASSLLQIQLDACKQELELERNRSRALHDRVRLLESASLSNPTLPKEDSRLEAEPELELLREELQKARDVLKTRSVEAEEQQKQLESTRSQFAECISEKERLEQLVTSLKKQLDEKEQALRDLRPAKVVDKTPRENKMSSLELKGRHQEQEAKTIQSPQQDLESLKLQHHLVTEQLKGLFRQRGTHLQQKNPCGSQEETPPTPQASQDVLISTMASEIQDLKQKNENLMQAKLRFQHQIEDIRRLSKRQPERSSAELPVPRLQSLAMGLQSAQGSDSSLPSLQSDGFVLPCLPSQEDRQPVMQEPELSSHAGKEQSGSTSDTVCAPISALPLQPNPSHSAPAVPSIKLSPRSATSLPDSESEGAFLSPLDSTLLSPRPFGSPRPWSPFKFQGSPEPPEA